MRHVKRSLQTLPVPLHAFDVARKETMLAAAKVYLALGTLLSIFVDPADYSRSFGRSDYPLVFGYVASVLPPTYGSN
jgi:hypothetical protein